MHENYKHSVLHRIRSRSVKRDNGCVEYRAGECVHRHGLLSITVDGVRKSVPASRALYMALHECWDLPRSVQVRHKCDTYCCVNEEHLYETG